MIRFIKVAQKHSDNLTKYKIKHQFAFEQITVDVNLSPQKRINEVLVDMLKYIAEIDSKAKYEVSDVTKIDSPIKNTVNESKNVTPEIEDAKHITYSFSMKLTTNYLMKAHQTNARQQFNRFAERHNLHKYGIFPAITIDRPIPPDATLEDIRKYEDDIAIHEGVYFNFISSLPRDTEITRKFEFQHSLESVRDCDEQIQWLFENIKDLTDSQLLWLMTNIIDYKEAKKVVNELKKKDKRLVVFYKIAKDMYHGPLPYSRVVSDGKFRFDYIWEAVNSPLTKTVQVNPAVPAIEHDVISKKLEEIFKQCLKDPEKRIHLVRLDTGTGKTTISMKYLSQNMAYIAPTHKLLLQSIEDVKRLNPDMMQHIVYIPQIKDEELPNCPMKNKMLEARKLGLVKEYQRLRKKVIDEEGSLELKEKYDGYKAALAKTEGIPFMTHQRFMITDSFKKSFNNVEIFLIDEDPTKIIFPSVEHSEEFVNKQLQSFIEFCTSKYRLTPNSRGKDAKKVEILEAIKKLIKNYQTNKAISVNIAEKFFKSNLSVIESMATEMVKSKTPQQLDIGSVLTCRFFVRKQNDSGVKFYTDNTEMFRNKKIIVMSATLNDKVHYPLFARQINPNIRYYDVGRTKNVGKVYCYAEFSTTKAALSNTPKYIERINQVINSLKIDNVLTYKDFKDMFPHITEQMHFYNSAGYNDLSGKNIAVVGTPNGQIEEVIALGYLITGKIPESYVDKTLAMKSQAIIKDEFKFSFFTLAHSDDEVFRQVHLWSTYNELLQAVGRARAVHHDCEVHVFSRLPIPQCILKNYSEVTNYAKAI